ncbi:VCBS repeat-containing protein, partial [bacterium]|nr:VCBS repeat-containing protein [bacterium]
SDLSIIINDGHGRFLPQVRYQIGVDPQDIVFSDVNNDGNLDVLVSRVAKVNVIAGYVSVLLGRGDGTLKTPVSFDVGNNPLEVTPADINNDGFIDIISTNQWGSGRRGDVSALINSGAND